MGFPRGSRWAVARKRYSCKMCGKRIAKGQRYFRVYRDEEQVALALEEEGYEAEDWSGRFCSESCCGDFDWLLSHP